MDSRQSKRRKGSKGPKRSSQSRTSVEEVEEPQHAIASAVEKINRRKKQLNRHREDAVPVASPSPEAESSRVASSSRSPIEAAFRRSKSDGLATPSRKLSKKRKASIQAAPTSSKQLSLAYEAEDDEADSLQASLQAESVNQLETSTHARLEALEEENARLRKEIASKDGVLEKQRGTIAYIYGQCTCTVCMELVWRPHVLAPCGHVFCARCLVAWFSKPALGESTIPQDTPNLRQLERTRTLNRTKSCPQCREKVTAAPVEVWLVKGLVDQIDKSMREGQGNDDHLVQGQESLAGLSIPAIDEAKGANLPASPAIWKDIFKPLGHPDEPIYDEEDQVFRCRLCTSEVVNGQCTNPTCQALFDVGGFLDEYDSMLDEDYSDEYDEEFPDEDDINFLDDGPIIIDGDSDDEDDDDEGPHLLVHHGDSGNDYDSVVFASGSEQDAIVISSSESSDDDDSIHELQADEEDEDELHFIDVDDDDDEEEEDNESNSSNDSLDQEL